ncbi:hypothetical protein Taro_003979 [Colocasia esculenta]|uniref:Uncharacterized protein n=1 Tax=Colocasia esculenta TaxID=4460 RepID=A0A843TTH7_COLES|nr:hypothetical protein [Colocasia esculenta]
MGCEFSVTTPLGEKEKLNKYFPSADVMIGEHNLKADLGRFYNVLGSWEAVLGHQEQRRMAGERDFFPNRALLRPVHNSVLDLHKGEAEENEYTHEDGEDQE